MAASNYVSDLRNSTCADGGVHRWIADVSLSEEKVRPMKLSALSLATLVLASCHPAARDPAARDPALPPTQPTSTASYNFTGADALARLSRVVPDLASGPQTSYVNSEGFSCTDRTVANGEWVICSQPTGKVHHISVQVMGYGTPKAEQLELAGKSAGAFMSLFEVNLSDGTDRARIMADVERALLRGGGYIAMDTYKVAVTPLGNSYEMLATADGPQRSFSNTQPMPSR